MSSLGKRAISAVLDPKIADKREMRLFERAIKNSERFDREVLPDGKIRFTPKQAITQPTTPATGTAAARQVPDGVVDDFANSLSERSSLAHLDYIAKNITPDAGTISEWQRSSASFRQHLLSLSDDGETVVAYRSSPDTAKKGLESWTLDRSTAQGFSNLHSKGQLPVREARILIDDVVAPGAAMDSELIVRSSKAAPIAKQADTAAKLTPEQQAIIDDVGTGALPADDVAVDALDAAPVSDGKAGGSGPPKLRNRPTADADFPPSSRSILDSPAPTIAAKDDPVIKRVAQAIKDTKPATKESLEALSKGRKRQIARAGSAARKAQTFGDVGSSATRAMGGEIPRPEFEPIAQLFTPDEVEALLSRIWGRGSVLEFANSPPGYINFRQINADAAFKKLFNPDSATLPTPYEMELLERVFGPEMIRAVLSKKKLGQKAWDLFLNLWNLPRALLATGDISATARQAAVLGPGNPKDFKNAFKAQLKAFANEEYARASREAIESDLDFVRFTTKSGRPVDIGTRQQQRLYIASLGEATDITRREEQFMSRFAGRLPLVRNSERAFVTMLNELRFKVMKRMVAAIEIGGKTATDEQLDAIASFINFATGRGSLGKAEGAAPLLNGIGFSPRLAVSRFQLPLPLLTRSPNVRKKFAKDLVAAAGGLYLFLWLADKHPDIDVEPNPFNSDFGKLRIGKTRFDFGAGTLQTARFIAQITSGKREAIGTKSQSEANRVQIATTFLRSKAHPSLGLGLDVANEEDFLGESFTLDSESFTKLDLRKNPVLRTFTMMFIQDIVEAWKESGPLMAAGAAIAAPLGVGVSSFSTVEDSSQELWGLPITEVQPFQQELAKELFARTSERSLGVFDQADINHYDVFQDIVKQFKSGDINKRTAVNRYFSTNTFYSGLRKGLSAGIFGGDLNEESVFPKAPSAGTDAEKAALQEYYDSSAPFESLSGFDSEEWEKVLKVLERKWKRDGTLEYVFANTNMRPVPAELLKLLPESTMKKIQQSHNARRNILRSLDAQEIEIDRTTLNARPDVYSGDPWLAPVPSAQPNNTLMPTPASNPAPAPSFGSTESIFGGR